MLAYLRENTWDCFIVIYMQPFPADTKCFTENIWDCDEISNTLELPQNESEKFAGNS